MSSVGYDRNKNVQGNSGAPCVVRRKEMRNGLQRFTDSAHGNLQTCFYFYSDASVEATSEPELNCRGENGTAAVD